MNKPEEREAAETLCGESRQDSRDDSENPNPQNDQQLRKRANDVVYRLLASRARSRTELRQALLRKGYEPELAESVIDRFTEAGLVDDAAFAESWVRSRHEHRGLGRRALRQELRQRGISEEDMEAAMSSVDDDAEEQRAREFVQRKLRMAGAPERQLPSEEGKRMRRLIAMLARRGYSEQMANRVVAEEFSKWMASGF